MLKSKIRKKFLKLRKQKFRDKLVIDYKIVYSLIKKFLSLEKVYLHYHVNIFSSYGIRKLFKSNGFNTQHSYKLSSYRGNTLTVLSGFAGKNIEDKKKDLFYEIFSLFKFSIHKIISKVKNR